MKDLKLLSDQVSIQELTIILRELDKTRTISGDVVEFGCYIGTTSVHLQRILNGERALHVYDSFAGLPEKTKEDISPAGDQFRSGELYAPKKEFIANFKKLGLPLPCIHKGWFSDLTAQDVPELISFAFLDGDYYESIMTPLRLIEDRLQKGSTIVVDDYSNEALPGAAKAVDKWRKSTKIHTTLQVEKSLAIIHITDLA